MNTLSDHEYLQQALDKAVINAEHNTASHLLMIETLVSTIATICKITLNNANYHELARTKKTVERIMVEMVSAMLQDYLEIERDDENKS